MGHCLPAAQLVTGIRGLRGQLADNLSLVRHRRDAAGSSLLIASGADVKTVQARLRRASAKTTLGCYGHLWPDRDQSTRSAVEAVFADHADSLRTTAASR